jgi:hypothetical protein
MTTSQLQVSYQLPGEVGSMNFITALSQSTDYSILGLPCNTFVILRVWSFLRESQMTLVVAVYTEPKNAPA